MSIFTKASSASYWRGFDYFENNHVFDLKKIDENVYSAKVRGTYIYDVTIDLLHPMKCTCTCPFVEGNHRMCKHMVAVAFAVCPNEVKRAKKARDDYFSEIRSKKQLLHEIMQEREQEIEEYLNKLTKSELKEELRRRLYHYEYDLAYESVYGYDADHDFEDDEEWFEDEQDFYDDDEEELSEYKEPILNDITDWKIGDKVLHKTLGVGKVVALEGNDILTVEFEKHGKKSILGRHCFVSRID